ncbi:hypothetical protein Leryth_008485 [Lithospermum erythrorhizon]|nr:hypothetical protein Leryth_008485 [Lithospermum erythrorhizon]
MFLFVDQPLLPSQSNFAPVEEIGETVDLFEVEGEIPDDFPQGVYIRNGPNPPFGGLKSTISIFGKSSNTWIEGEGMLHALYFDTNKDGNWTIHYNNKIVQTETYKIEKLKGKPAFLPAIEGDSIAILWAYLLNKWRFGEFNKCLSNTNIFEHSGKLYSIAENHMPQRIDIQTLRSLGNWKVLEDWDRPFTSHPKKDPRTGELICMGIDAQKPYFVLGVISANGKDMVHKVDLKFNRCTLCHELSITQRYNVIPDFPLTIDINRLSSGGPLIKYNPKEYARIGVMPRYGDADSVLWFEVESCCVFHILNCFEDGHEVVVRACRAKESIIPGPDFGLEKYEWFSQGFKKNENVGEENNAKELQSGFLFSRTCEWRLNFKTGEVKEKLITGTRFSMDFPMVNENFIGLRNKYGYTQVVDSTASSIAGMAKYGGLAKLHFEEQNVEHSSDKTQHDDWIKVEYHMLPQNTFCSGAAFIANPEGLEEDDGWIITFVHNEDNDISQVYIIDAKKFSSDPIVKITLPCRVPYGFHSSFIPTDKSSKL